MIGLTYDDIVTRLQQYSGLTAQQISEKVKQKVDALSGLVSREGALHIIANELGLDLLRELKKTGLKINRVAVGMRNVSVCGKVIHVDGVRAFEKEGKKGSVGSFLMADETGPMRVVVWDTKLQSHFIQGTLREGVVVKAANGYVKENNGYKEMHLGSYSELVLNPEGVTVGDVHITSAPTVHRVSVAALQDGMLAEIQGTIVQMFAPRFYSGCPTCSKKIDGPCPTHHLEPEQLPVLNFLLDDGTETVRVALFKDEVVALTGLDVPALKSAVDQGTFDVLQAKILGSQVGMTGRVRLNEVGGHLELVGRNVHPLDAKMAVERLLRE